MLQHEEFIKGFADALGLSGSECQKRYIDWIHVQRLSVIELIDIESGGYKAGLEAGHQYKNSLPPSTVNWLN